MNADFGSEVSAGTRFEFGRNWASFLGVLDEERIGHAVLSLKSLLGMESLEGKTFIDIGSGSGLFSLAAMRMGAERVHSLDFDTHSVACTLELRRRYYPDSQKWYIEHASALDSSHLSELGLYDIVYSWGVLHHTGEMWKGLSNAARLVKPEGTLVIAIYNDQGIISKMWKNVKIVYNCCLLGKLLMIFVFFPYFYFRGLISDICQGKNPFRRFSEYKKLRGMSLTHDWIDWIGGLPFEVASPGAIFEFFHTQKFSLSQLRTVNGLGCNQFVFRRNEKQTVTA